MQVIGRHVYDNKVMKAIVAAKKTDFQQKIEHQIEKARDIEKVSKKFDKVLNKST